MADGCGNQCSIIKVSGEDQGLQTFWAERLTSQGKFRELHLAVDFSKKNNWMQYFHFSALAAVYTSDIDGKLMQFFFFLQYTTKLRK